MTDAAMTSADKLHWEDFAPGRVDEYGPRLVTREEIVEFASQFDPQPMHLDEEAARHSMLKGLGASGFHSCSILMRLIADGFVNRSASMGAPGVDEVKWRAPVRPGDRLRVRATVTETRASNSRPDMGFVKFHFEMLNAEDTCVMTLVSSLMIGRRRPGAPLASNAKTEG
jgi:acyl dehydratase